MRLQIATEGRYNSRSVQPHAAVLVLIVLATISFTGCTVSTTNEETKKDMNSLSSPERNWTDQEVKLLSTQSGKTSDVSAKKLVFEDAEVRPFPTPIVAFVAPNGKAYWIGPEQDFYLQDSVKVYGISLGLYDIAISWCECLSFNGLPAKIADTDQIITHLNSQVELVELRKASVPFNCKASGRVDKTDLRDCFADSYFFSSGEWSSQPSNVNIVAAEVQDSTIRLEIENKQAGRRGVVWIDIVTRSVTKAMENDKQTWPRDNSESQVDGADTVKQL